MVLGFFNDGVIWSLVSAVVCSFNRLVKTSLGFVTVQSGVEDDSGSVVVAPLASSLRVLASGVKPDDGRGGVNLDFLPANCTTISYRTVHTAYMTQPSFNS